MMGDSDSGSGGGVGLACRPAALGRTRDHGLEVTAGPVCACLKALCLLATGSMWGRGVEGSPSFVYIHNLLR